MDDEDGVEEEGTEEVVGGRVRAEVDEDGVTVVVAGWPGVVDGTATVEVRAEVDGGARSVVGVDEGVVTDTREEDTAAAAAAGS